jgi:hypothetical protein
MRERGVRFLLNAYQMDEFFISKLVCLQHPIPFLDSQVLVRDRHVPHIPFLLQSVCAHCRRDESYPRADTAITSCRSLQFWDLDEVLEGTAMAVAVIKLQLYFLLGGCERIIGRFVFRTEICAAEPLDLEGRHVNTL